VTPIETRSGIATLPGVSVALPSIVLEGEPLAVPIGTLRAALSELH
jgi:hypothetical protein